MIQRRDSLRDSEWHLVQEEGMGPRMREDTEEGGQRDSLKSGLGDGSPHARGHGRGARGRAVREPSLRGRMLSGTGFTPILTFPPQGGRDLLVRYCNEILRLGFAALGMMFGGKWWGGDGFPHAEQRTRGGRDGSGSRTGIPM